MRYKFDKGNLLEDLKAVVNDAKNRQPALIVVPTEREARTFERNFASELEGHFVWCCSFADYYNGSWMKATPRPKHIYGFRDGDIWKNYAADASVEYVTDVRWNRKKEEE